MRDIVQTQYPAYFLKHAPKSFYGSFEACRPAGSTFTASPATPYKSCGPTGSLTFSAQRCSLDAGKASLFHDLLMQLRIRGVSDILFLIRRINEGRIMMMAFVIPVIHTNAFLKDKFYSLLTDTLAEMNQF